MFAGFLTLIALSFNLHAFTNQKVNGKLAYYGENFSVSHGGNVRAELHDILASKHQSRPGKFDVIGNCGTDQTKCYQHSAVGYSRARIIMFGDLFIEQDNRGNYVIEVYCNRRVYFREASDISNMSNVVNIEHTWPQSKFNPGVNKELQKSDMHHLFPSDSKANSVRANHVFGEPASPGFMGQDLCEPSQIDNDGSRLVFTPPETHKGNVARALFYFAVRYDMEISQAEEKYLREWHKNDPVDAEESERHEKIASYQFNRNPFIDYPELVNVIKDF